MGALIDNPFAVFAIAVIAQWAAALLGDVLRRTRPLKKGEGNDFDTVLTAALTLLALIIGFSFSMAVTRYDQRKNYEAAEANAIGTAYLRADLLPADTAASVRQFLKLYVQQRVNFFNSNGQPRQEAGSDPAKLRDELWSSVVGAAGAQPNPVLALAVSGMNDVFNSQADTMAAWLNRIPTGAWVLMVLIAVFSNLLLGYRERSSGRVALLVLPVIASIAFYLIADIDSPYVGVISVFPHNLIATSEAMRSHH
jgi:hypothetical protein